jgi:hypothetical protein
VELSDENVEDLLEVLLLSHNVPKIQLFSEMDHNLLMAFFSMTITNLIFNVSVTRKFQLSRANM